MKWIKGSKSPFPAEEPDAITGLNGGCGLAARRA
jgi:hypothetical protein